MLNVLLHLDFHWVVKMSQEPRRDDWLAALAALAQGTTVWAVAPTLVTYGCLDLVLYSSTFPFLGIWVTSQKLLISENNVSINSYSLGSENVPSLGRVHTSLLFLG